MIEQVSGEEREQQQNQEQIQDDVMLQGQGEKEGLSGEMEGFDYEEWGQEDRERRTQGQGGPEDWVQGKRMLRELEEGSMDFQYAENQSVVGKSEEVTGKQDQGQRQKVISVQETEEEAGSNEEEPGNGGGQGAAEGERSMEEKEHHSPSPLALVAAEVLSPCDFFPDVSYPMAQIPGTQTEPRPEELTPRALIHTVEPTVCSPQPISLAGSFAPGESLDNQIAQDLQQEGSELRKRTVSTQSTEVVSANPSVTSPGTPDSAPFSPAEVSPITTALSSSSLQVPFLGGRLQELLSQLTTYLLVRYQRVPWLPSMVSP
jgi:hypothetical protein